MRPLLLLAGLLAGPAFLHAQAHKIAISLVPAPGQAFALHKKETATVRTRFVGPDGETRNIVQEMDTTERYIESVTARIGGRAITFDRKYLEATTRENDKDKPRSFAERTVHFTWKDGRYSVHLPRPALPAAEVEELVRTARASDGFRRMMPDKAVRVGETWALPKDALADFTPAPLDLAKSKGEGKLLKVYDKAGGKRALLELRFEGALKAMGGLEFDPPAALKMSGQLDASLVADRVDSHWKAEATVTGKGTLVEKGRKSRFELVGGSKAEATRAPVK